MLRGFGVFVVIEEVQRDGALRTKTRTDGQSLVWDVGGARR